MNERNSFIFVENFREFWCIFEKKIRPHFREFLRNFCSKIKKNVFLRKKIRFWTKGQKFSNEFRDFREKKLTKFSRKKLNENLETLLYNKPNSNVQTKMFWIYRYI